MTKLFKNSKSVLSFVLAFAVLAVSLFTGVVINSDAASCEDDLSKLNVVYVDNSINSPAHPTKGTGTAVDPYIIEGAAHLRYIAQESTPATTYGKYYKVDDSIDILVLQREGYIKGVAGSLEAFLALDANGVKAALSKENTTVDETQYDRITFQSGSKAAGYDSFAGTIDFNGVTICGMYNQNGGLIAVVNGGTTLKNVTLCNNYISSGWYNGNLIGYVHNGTVASSVTNDDGTTTNVYRPLTISDVVVHDCYQTTTGNGYSNTGVLMGTAVNSKNIPVLISNILTYDNISLGTVSSSDTTQKNCALYGQLPSSWSGENDGVTNASYSNIVTLDCVPYPTQTINNQCTKPAYWSNVYTTMLDSENREPCTWYQDGDQWGLFDITKIANADAAKGAAAKTNMPKLDWESTWVAVDGAYPELQAFHDFKATDNEDGYTHTTKCSECSLAIGTTAHNYVDGVCACGYTAKCGEVIMFWDGTKDSVLADVGETGAADSPIIIDNAAELNYLVSSVAPATTTGKYYKMADGIDKIILQPESIATLDADNNGVYDILETTDVKAYYEAIGVANLANWTSADTEMWFNGTFDGNNVQFVGMYAKAGSVGLFPTADGAATIKNVGVVNSYFHGTKTRANGNTNGQCRTGALVGGTCGVGYGAKIQGTVTFDTILVANNYIYNERSFVNAAIVMGADNGEEAVVINNAIVYGNVAVAADAPEASAYLFNGKGTDGVSTSKVTNSIILGTNPYYSNCKAAENFENVYTDADVTGYDAANMASVAGLTGAELAAAAENLDWTDTFLATADMPTFRAWHDATFAAVDNLDGTHSAACSCGLAITAEGHDWVDGVCTVCGAMCDHGEGDTEIVIQVEKTPATCTEAGWYYDMCTICGITTENMEEGIYQIGTALGHDLAEVTGTPATCEEDGTKTYYECTREGCDAIFEDAEGKTAIDNLDEWIVIEKLGHVASTDENGTVYSTHGGWHYMVCDREDCGAEFNGEACDGEYVADGANGCTGVCETCGVETAAGARHAFDEEYKCSRCGWSCEEHTPGTATKENEVEKTCTTDGSYDEVVKCTVCEYVISSEHVTVPSGHSVAYTWKENEEPACIQDGSYDEVGRCYVCEEEVRTTIPVPKQGHIFNTVPASEPTCVWTGNEEHKTCYECWNDFAATEEDIYSENYITEEDYEIAIDPDNHTWEEHEAVEATCDTDGMLAYKQCTACNYAVSEDGEVEAYIEIDQEAYDAAFVAEVWPLQEAIYNAESYEDWIAAQEAYNAAAEALNARFVTEAAVAAGFGIEGGHDLVEVEKVEPTYDAEGKEAHYACEVCDKLFADAEGTEEVTAESLVIDKLVKEEETPSTDNDKTDGEDKEDDKSTDDDKKDDTSTSTSTGNKTEDKNENAAANADKSPDSPKTGETVATVAAAVVAVIAAGFVLVRKARKA